MYGLITLILGICLIIYISFCCLKNLKLPPNNKPEPLDVKSVVKNFLTKEKMENIFMEVLEKHIEKNPHSLKKLIKVSKNKPRLLAKLIEVKQKRKNENKTT